jgi:hypothetical protein
LKVEKRKGEQVNKPELDNGDCFLIWLH